MADRPADIISPASSEVLQTKMPAADARADGRVGYDKPTPQNSVMLFIDHQIGLMVGVRDFPSLATYKANVVVLAKIAIALSIPVLLSSSNAQWQNGDTLPELKEIFSDQPIYRRTGIINCYEDPTFRAALDELLGSVGSAAVQLAVVRGARVIGTASPANHGYLRSLGAEPVAYGEGLIGRVRALAPGGVDVALDVAGSGVLPELIQLADGPGHVVTIADFGGAREHGVRFSSGDSGRAAHALAGIGELIESGRFSLPVARTFSLADVAEAHRVSQHGHAHGKLVLLVG